MLRDDPPLPGDERAEWQQWPGLEPSVNGEHAGHGAADDGSRDTSEQEDHGHGAGDRPASDAPPSEEPEDHHEH
jgi:hypothetical protein